MRATIKMIAERAGVSIGTVDRVLHDRPYVKEEVRRRVLEVMEELDYQPNRVASALATSGMARHFAIIQPTWESYVGAAMAAGVEKFRRERQDYNVHVTVYPYPQGQTETCLRLLDQAAEETQGIALCAADCPPVREKLEELERLARQDVAAARGALEDILSNYQGFRRCVVILVFDAYKVKGNPGSVERRNGIYVVYTKEAETADAYIEKTTYEIAREHRVRVVTSDGAEQLIILGHGALRLPAASFRREVEEAEGEISAILARHNRGERSRPVKEALERAAAKERSGPGSGRKR